MKTLVEFRSDAFPAYPGEEEEINPGCYGKRLAEFVSQSLCQQGVEAASPIPEDWGWIVAIKQEAFPLWIGCSNYEEYEDGFLCFIEPHKPFVWRWFRKVNTQDHVAALQIALDQVLSAHPQVRQLRWWTYEEFNQPENRHT